MKKRFFLLLPFIIIINLYSHEYVEEINDNTNDLQLGNKWYSKYNLLLFQSIELGNSGVMDYLKENFNVIFKFKSKNKHIFSIRFNQYSFTIGTLRNKFKFFDYSFLIGFEYLYKIFSNYEGIYVWGDIGFCNWGLSFNMGIGVGNRLKNGFELDFLFMQCGGFFLKMNIFFLLFDFLSLKINTKFDYYLKNNLEFYNFSTGLLIGFLIKKFFRFELGGGFTLNDYYYFSGFGILTLSFDIK